MKDKWDKLKISSEALKNNWPMLLLILGGLSSGIGNITQGYFANEDEELKTAMAEQITILAETYVRPSQPKTVIRQNCDACMVEVRKLRSEFHD